MAIFAMTASLILSECVCVCVCMHDTVAFEPICDMLSVFNGVSIFTTAAEPHTKAIPN